MKNTEALKFLKEITNQQNLIKEEKLKFISEIITIAKKSNYQITYDELISAAKQTPNLEISQWILTQTKDLELTEEELKWVAGGTEPSEDEPFLPGTY